MNRATRSSKVRCASPHHGIASDARSLCAQGSQGLVQFFLQRVQGGLYVEREEIPRRGVHTTQSVAFADAASFRRWCDEDPIRFVYPLLHAQLRRDGDELWRAAEQPEGH
jgi:hypothetical protein